MFCHTCVRAVKLKLLFNSKTDPAFITTRLQSWKDALRRFSKHQASNCHKEATQKLVSVSDTSGHVDELFSSLIASDTKSNRENLLLILRSIKFLGRQGITLRGASQAGRGEVDGNFLQLLDVFSEFHPSLREWQERKRDKYTSADIQNEMLQVVALRIFRTVEENIGERKSAIMVDETTDSSCTEQCVIVIRWVDSELCGHEEFLGFYAISTANADIKDTLLRMNLKLQSCRVQCYNGAATMLGRRKGVAKQILMEEARALHTYCYGHALNLACQDMIRDVKHVKDALDVTFQLSKLLKYSAKRTAEYQCLKQELAPEQPGFRILCPTRWTVRAASLSSILTNYQVLQECLESFTELAKMDREMSAKCNGVRSQFATFDFLFSVALGKKVLTLADNLSKSLQAEALSASEGQAIAQSTCASEAQKRGEVC